MSKPRIVVEHTEIEAWVVKDTKTGKQLGMYAEWHPHKRLGAPYVTIQVTLDQYGHVDRDDVGVASNMSPDELIIGVLRTLVSEFHDDEELYAALRKELEDALKWPEVNNG